MAWHDIGDKPLTEPMMTWPISMTHYISVCVSQYLNVLNSVGK